jgi:hypothetical protein
MSKKIITETSDMEYNAETGKYEVQRTQQVAILSTEDKYYKFYHQGLIYISDMPPEYHRVFYALLDNMTYVDQKVEGLGDFGMHIFLNKPIKEGIAESLGMGNSRSIDNVITKLVKGEVLFQVGRGIYRPNPYIVARGAWKEIAHLRAECGHPFAAGDTFKAVCARKDMVKQRIAEVMADQAKHQPAPPVKKDESTAEQPIEAAQ